MIRIRQRAVHAWVMMMLIVCIAAGCTGGNPDAGPVPEDNKTTSPKALSTEPVTLKIMYYNTLVQKEDIDKFIAEPIKKKYPFITVEYIQTINATSLSSLIAAGQAKDIPDLVITDYPNLSGLMQYNYPLDLNELLKRENVNLSKLDKIALDGVKAMGSKGELYGLPFYLDKYMMFYNKDIFDRFAIPYPTDDMSYEDLVTLVKKLTRKDDKIDYIGYRWGNLYTVGMQFGLPVINSKTGKAEIQTEGWKHSLSMVKQMLDAGVVVVQPDAFFKERRLAIYPQWLGAAYGLFTKETAGLNWDLAAMPYSKDQPKTSGPAKPLYLTVSSVSQHKEQAAAVVSYLTTSQEVQMLLSQNGRISVLKDDAIQKQFGNKLDVLQGKNVSAVFKHPFGQLPYTNSYEAVAWPALNASIDKVIKGQDVNSALRDAEEEANKKVDEVRK